MPPRWQFYRMIIPGSWVRGFRFKPGKPPKVIDLVVARKIFGLNSVWPPNSCWSRYTPLWGEALFLQSQAVQRKPSLPLFSWRLRELSDMEWTGPGVLSRSSLGPCFTTPGSDLEAAVCLLAAPWNRSAGSRPVTEF